MLPFLKACTQHQNSNKIIIKALLAFPNRIGGGHETKGIRQIRGPTTTTNNMSQMEAYKKGSIREESSTIKEHDIYCMSRI